MRHSNSRIQWFDFRERARLSRATNCSIHQVRVIASGDGFGGLTHSALGLTSIRDPSGNSECRGDS